MNSPDGTRTVVAGGGEVRGNRRVALSPRLARRRRRRHRLLQRARHPVHGISPTEELRVGMAGSRPSRRPERRACRLGARNPLGDTPRAVVSHPALRRSVSLARVPRAAGARRFERDQAMDRNRRRRAGAGSRVARCRAPSITRPGNFARCSKPCSLTLGPGSASSTRRFVPRVSKRPSTQMPRAGRGGATSRRARPTG